MILNSDLGRLIWDTHSHVIAMEERLKQSRNAAVINKKENSVSIVPYFRDCHVAVFLAMTVVLFYIVFNLTG